VEKHTKQLVIQLTGSSWPLKEEKKVKKHHLTFKLNSQLKAVKLPMKKEQKKFTLPHTKPLKLFLNNTKQKRVVMLKMLSLNKNTSNLKLLPNLKMLLKTSRPLVLKFQLTPHQKK
jgi:hypothetical protein